MRLYAPPRHREHHTPHSFRHGAVAAWIDAGITDRYKISRYLGHGTPTLLRITEIPHPRSLKFPTP